MHYTLSSHQECQPHGDYKPVTPSLEQNHAKSAERAKSGRHLTPFQRKLLQEALCGDLPDRYHQRIEIMLLADAGKSQAQICSALACSQSTARHWIFMARTGMAHCWRENPVGRPKQVTDAYLERLRELVSQHPHDCGYSFERWSAKWLSQRLAREFGLSLSDRHVNRLLKQMGLSTRALVARADAKPSAKTQTTSRPGIVIRHLPSEAVSDFSSNWAVNPFKPF